MKKAMMFLLAAMIFMLPTQTAMAAEISDINREAWEDIGSMADVPTFEMVDNEDGTFSVTAVDCDGNVIFTEEKVSGSVDEIIEDVYKAIYNDYVGEERNAKSSCTHIPCNQSKVWGGINHVISGDTCTMIRSQFYKCACCSQIIGMVPNSTVVVGTHAAH